MKGYMEGNWGGIAGSSRLGCLAFPGLRRSRSRYLLGVVIAIDKAPIPVVPTGFRVPSVLTV
jgi:hypothetical protein